MRRGGGEDASERSIRKAGGAWRRGGVAEFASRRISVTRARRTRAPERAGTESGRTIPYKATTRAERTTSVGMLSKMSSSSVVNTHNRRDKVGFGCAFGRGSDRTPRVFRHAARFARVEDGFRNTKPKIFGGRIFWRGGMQIRMRHTVECFPHPPLRAQDYSSPTCEAPGSKSSACFSTSFTIMCFKFDSKSNAALPMTSIATLFLIDSMRVSTILSNFAISSI